MTARYQAQTVAQEARDQTRRVVERLQDRVGVQAQHQSERLAHNIRTWADELASMSDSVKPDSPLHGVVHQLADRGRHMADYLEHEGLASVVDEVQDFARRRPGMFLAGALAAGFLVGRVVKAAQSAGPDTSPGVGPGAGPETRGIAEGGYRDTTQPQPGQYQPGQSQPGQSQPGQYQRPGSQSGTTPSTLPPTSGDATGPPSTWRGGDL